MKKYFIKYSALCFAILALASLNACQPETFGDGNGLSDPNADATFTVTPVEGSANKFMIKANATNLTANRWDFGDGGPEFAGSDAEELFLPDADTYTITHKAIGRGGIVTVSTQQIVIPTSDPIAGNLVKGGKLRTADEFAQWTVLNISANDASLTFTPSTPTLQGHVTFTATNYQQKAIYQAIDVVANRKYKIDMRVFGAAAFNTWFEVYASKTAPVQGQDYAADGKRIGLSTWDGCATSAFDNKLSVIKCVGSGNVVQFAESGTIYLLIKCGGENVGIPGISATNIEFRGQPD